MAPPGRPSIPDGCASDLGWPFRHSAGTVDRLHHRSGGERAIEQMPSTEAAGGDVMGRLCRGGPSRRRQGDRDGAQGEFEGHHSQQGRRQGVTHQQCHDVPAR